MAPAKTGSRLQKHKKKREETHAALGSMYFIRPSNFLLWFIMQAIAGPVLVFSCLISTVYADWVDPDSPNAVRRTTALTNGDDRRYRLVFSDEFEQDGRTFHDGNDPRWTALNKNDYTNNPLHYYSHDSIRTSQGMLNLKTDLKPKEFKIFNERKQDFDISSKEVRSGMLQSWNKFCFTGGIVEFSAKLPGDPRTGGLWPAIWMLGNLGRATYLNSTEFMWPFSTNQCTNRTRNIQEINACSGESYDGMPPYQGRGAPEIDVFEVMIMQGWEHPVLSASLQVAPGIEEPRPTPGHAPNGTNWYKNIEYANGGMLNTYFYGVTVLHKSNASTYQSDAISCNALLNESHYYEQHLYRVEWEPPNDEEGSGGYLKWFIDGELVTGIYGDSLQEASGTEIPSEPMYLLMNTAVSKDWGFPDAYYLNCKCKCWTCSDPCCRKCALPEGYCDNFPAFFEIDYVRVYQAEQEPKHIFGCSPKSRPTEAFIEAHLERYMLKGETRPLQPIKEGGGSCDSDNDCGDQERGTCSSEGICTCAAGWTGPHCLAHAPFYNTSANEFVISFTSRTFRGHLIRTSLILGIIAVLVFVMMWRERLSKEKGAPYEKLIEVSESAQTAENHSSATSYQREGPRHEYNSY